MRAEMEIKERAKKRWTLDDIRTYFAQHNIRISVYRLKIFEYLINERTHPTAEEIFQHLKKELPAISPGTVYNTMRHFLEKKIIQQVNVGKNEARYDATLSWHGHFKCLSCRKVFDVHVENLKLSGLDGFEIYEKHLDLKGLCPSCLKSKKF